MTGQVIDTYYYDAFGNIMEEVGDTNNPYRYAGYQYDAETGLYYLNARMYDPKIARFLQEDTYLGDPQDVLSLNLYTYCANNPLVYYDPSGHFWEEAWDITKGAGQGLWDVGKGLVTGTVDTAKMAYKVCTNDPLGTVKKMGEKVAWTFESKANMTATWNTAKEKAGEVKNALVSYGQTKYQDFREADLQGKSRIIAGIGGEIALIAVPIAKVSKLGKVSKAEKALNAANQLDNITDATKSLTAIEKIKNTTSTFANEIKAAFGYTKTLVANESGYVRIGGLSKAESSIARKIQSLKAKGFQEHHIISNKNLSTKTHELFERAGYKDPMEFLESRTNKMFLPSDPALHATRSIHKGKHLQSVSDELADMMKTAVKTGTTENWTTQQFNEMLMQIVQEERQLLRQGNRVLNKNHR